MLRTLSAAVLFFSIVAPAAAAPEIRSVSPSGLRIGAVTTLTIEGKGLSSDPQIVLPFAGARQTVKAGATPERVELEIELPEAIQPGVFQLRLATPEGVSNAVVVGVDGLPQSMFRDEIDALPAALSGDLTGDATLRTSFSGKAGDRIVIDVESRRLGAKLDPVVHLYDARGTQVAWAQGASRLFGDARLTATLPADGRYTVELHDDLYRGESPGRFRLKIGALHYADVVYPLAIERGASARLQFVRGNLPADATVEAAAQGAVVQMPAPWPDLNGVTGVAPGVAVSDMKEIVEPADGSEVEPVDAPAGFNGRLAASGEQDRFRVRVTPGSKLRVEVVAERAGSPLDGVLTVQNAEGRTLASGDDQPGTTDPGVDVDVPDGVDEIVLALKDLLGRGGADFVYRIAVRPAAAPDFSVSAFVDRLNSPRDDVALLRVRAARAGYNGAIRLSLPGLPPGVELSNAEIPAGAMDALVTLHAGAGEPAAVITSIVAEATDDGVKLVRAATLPETPLAKYRPWFSAGLGLAVTAPAPLSIAWREGSASDDALPLAGFWEAGVQVHRAEGVAGAVRLTLLTSQIMPKKEVDKEQVDDLDRALRLTESPRLAPEQSQAALRVLVPGDLPDIQYDLAMRAELLGEDGEQVVATAVTPSRRMRRALPTFRLALAGEPNIVLETGVTPRNRLAGRIERSPGFASPVTVTLTGLPDDVPPPSVVVPGDQDEFMLPLIAPYSAELGDLNGVRLTAASQLTPSLAAPAANEIELTAKVVAGGPPPALFPVFEDEAAFAARLHEGEGEIALDTDDRYSGAAAVRVTPVQRYRAELPGLGVKIKEAPGEGEYRYLRFAWKKRGGKNIMLQLHANGGWGPSAGGEGPAFRYQAGPAGNPFRAAAVRLDENLPKEWVVVTRDLYQDFGEFELDGLALTASDGEAALFDQIYLARAEEDLENCPARALATEPLTLFEDDAEFVAELTSGGGQATLTSDDVYSGAASVKVTPDQRYNAALPRLGVKIAEHPGPGEYRYLRFAWKKSGGEIICLQINHDGAWGPSGDNQHKFRYDAGPRPGESYGAAFRISDQLPVEWTVVTRDLYADFGEFTFTGLALSPQDGEYGLFDHLRLARSVEDFEGDQP